MSALSPIPSQDITALVLAGGRGTRLGGVDKGLQPFLGEPLALRALKRMAPQAGHIAVNANRNLEIYRSWGYPVWSDSITGFPGPLAGMLTGLERCTTPWLLTVPCDSPRLPRDLAWRLTQAVHAHGHTIAMAAAPQDGEPARAHPVFCLLHRSMREGLAGYLASGSHRVMQWIVQHPHSVVNFDAPHDDPYAFANTNTLDDLHALERLTDEDA